MKRWGALILGVFGAAVAAVAEDITLTTSPALCRTALETRTVRGASLAPLLTAGEEVTLTMDPERCLPIARGDVVAYQPPSRPDPFLKIVKAVPGDRFALRQEADGWRLLVNGEVVTTSEGRPYAFGERGAWMLGGYVEESHGIIPPARYLLLGNLAGGSIDSSRFGLVARERIVGKRVSR